MTSSDTMNKFPPPLGQTIEYLTKIRQEILKEKLAYMLEN